MKGSCRALRWRGAEEGGDDPVLGVVLSDEEIGGVGRFGARWRVVWYTGGGGQGWSSARVVGAGRRA
jgi:hypothetical protein